MRQQEAMKAVRRRYLGEVAVLASRRDELEAVLQQVRVLKGAPFGKQKEVPMKGRAQ
jgi:hypothetical protein